MDHRPPAPRDLVDAILFAVLGLVVLAVGEPQPLAIITAGIAFITATYIVVRSIDRKKPR